MLCSPEAPPVRLLVTGSRDWKDRELVSRAMKTEIRKLNVGWERPLLLVHGNCKVNGVFVGADWIADDIWREWVRQFGEFYGFLAPEKHPASDHESPKARNLHMISLGAEACIAFATRWASGTGHCARAARRAGIPTVDYGVSTRIEDKPAGLFSSGVAA